MTQCYTRAGAAMRLMAGAVAAFSILGAGGYRRTCAAPPTPPQMMAPATGAAPLPIFHPAPMVAVDAPTNKLHLTAAQQTKLNAIMSYYFQKRNAIVTNKNQTQAQMQSAYATLAHSTHAKMLAILTPAQKASLSDHEAQQKKYIAGAQQAHAKAQSYSDQLKASLTPAQKTKIESIEKTANTQLGALIANKTMTIAQKTQQQSVMHDSLRDQIKAVLNPTQQQLFANFTRYADEADSLMRLAQTSGV